MSTKRLELPSNTVIISNGRVQQTEDWTLWNGEPWCTIEFRREPDGRIFAIIGDPEHGGASQRGTIEEVTRGLNPTIAEKFIRAFNLEGATEESVRDAGLERYKVVMA